MDPAERSRLLKRLARRIGAAIPVVEDDHFIACPKCGQYYDTRDFTEVWYHDDHPHPPMKPDA
jgi:hypothetical protein